MVELEIRVTNGTTLGVLAKNDKQGVAAADELCKTFGLNWKAMISDGMFRVASETGGRTSARRRGCCCRTPPTSTPARTRGCG
jgi:hypothetical protein